MKSFFSKKMLLGFTLIELMISVVLMGIVGLAITSYFSDIFKQWFKVSNQISSQQEARVVIEEMTSFIRQSSNPVAGMSPAIGAASSSEISFLYSGSQGNKQMKYYKNGDELFRVVNGVTSTVIHGGLQSVYFTHVSSYVVEIGSMVVRSGDDVFEMNKTVYLRNREY
ncbi:MAG: prepilin-type N-terminal cleavage/methylation domain-containing protein [Elusimicrobiota bacterium]